MLSDQLKILVNIIVQDYLIKTYCVTIITDDVTDIFLEKTNIPFLHYSTSSDENTMKSLILKSLDLGCSDFIINIDNPETFVAQFEENIHVTNQRRGNRKLIFVPNEHNLDSREKLIQLLKIPAIEFVPDVLLILPLNKTSEGSNETLYELGTQKYLSERDNNELIILNVWSSENRSFEKKANLFPDKVSNMQGRIVKMATFNYKPYSIFELDENNNTVVDGTEYRAAREFCLWSNCTIQIVRDDVQEWGEIFDNRTGNGIIGNVVTDVADFGYGALYSWYHEYMFLDLTMPVIRTGITVIAPAPSLVASWLLPVLPFNAVMWFCVIISIVYFSIAMFITANSGKNSFSVVQSVLGVVGIILLQDPSVKQPPPSLRTVIALLFLFSLMLSNIYSSGLASSITVPIYEDPIDTVQQLADSNLNWGATHDAWIFSILLATEPNMKRLVKSFKKWPFDKLKSRGKTRDFAYSVERLPAGHFAIGEYVTEEAVSYLQLMTQDIYWEQCVMMARKSSPFTRRLNKLFGRLHQAGLLQAWETQVVLKWSNFAVQLGVRLSPGRKSGSGGPRALGLTHLEGPIMLCVLGSVAGGLAFAVEVFMGRSERVRAEQQRELGKLTTGTVLSRIEVAGIESAGIESTWTEPTWIESTERQSKNKIHWTTSVTRRQRRQIQLE